MKFSSFKYLFKQGVKNFFHNKRMSAASVGVVTSCLVLMGFCLSLVLNVNSFVSYLGDQNEIIIYIKNTADETQITAIKEKLNNDEEVKKYTFVTKEEALEEQKSYLGQYRGLLSGYEDENNPLPASFRVHVNDLTKVSQVSLRFSGYDGVDYVSTPTELASVLIALKNITYYAGLFILGMLVLVSMVVISNTIRLTVYARRKEISIMKYVGATNGFIELPFVVEGLLIGTVSAVVTFALVSGGYIYLYGELSSLTAGFLGMLALSAVPYRSVWMYFLGGFMLFGWVIGGFASVLSMRRYLRV